jgi:hypothetical protein
MERHTVATDPWSRRRWARRAARAAVVAAAMTSAALGASTVLAVPVGPTEPSWGAPVNILTTSDDAPNDVKLTASSDGARLTALWSVYGEAIQAASSADGGAHWGAPVNLTTEAGSDSPDVVSSADGLRLTAVWEISYGKSDPGDPEGEPSVWYCFVQSASSADGGSTWGAPATLATWSTDLSGEDASEECWPSPQVTASEDGTRVAVVWQRSTGSDTTVVQVATSADGGTSWISPVSLSTASYRASPQVTSSADGMRLTTVWNQAVRRGEDQPTDYSIQAASSPNSGLTWGAPVAVTTAQDDGGLQITSSRDGSRLTAAWRRLGDNGSVLQTSVSTDGGATWGTPVNLSTGTQGWSDGLRVTSSGDGIRLTALWVLHYSYDNNSVPVSIVQAANSADGGATWGTPVNLSPAGRQAEHAQVTSSHDGAALTAVWVFTVSGRGSPYVYKIVQAASSADGGASWGTPLNLSSADYSGSMGSYPQVASSGEGARRTAAWVRSGGVAASLEASSWPSSTPSITAVAVGNAKATKLVLTITPRSETATTCNKGFRFRIQKAKSVSVSRGSDEPTYKVTWRTLKGTYRTSANGWPKTKVLNLGKGTYRAVVSGNCGYQGATSNRAPLNK